MNKLIKPYYSLDEVAKFLEIENVSDIFMLEIEVHLIPHIKHLGIPHERNERSGLWILPTCDWLQGLTTEAEPYFIDYPQNHEDIIEERVNEFAQLVNYRLLSDQTVNVFSVLIDENVTCLGELYSNAPKLRPVNLKFKFFAVLRESLQGFLDKNLRSTSGLSGIDKLPSVQSQREIAFKFWVSTKDVSVIKSMKKEDVWQALGQVDSLLFPPLGKDSLTDFFKEAKFEFKRGRRAIK
jgi:hypothetical protein